jgi:hypothetical protein
MPYIGAFTEAAIQGAIDRAGSKLKENESGLVVHLDDKGEFSVSVIQKIGSHVSVEVAGVMDTTQGFTFDKEKIRLQAELIARWGG